MPRRWIELSTGRIVLVVSLDPLWLRYEGEPGLWTCDVLDFYLWGRFCPE